MQSSETQVRPPWRHDVQVYRAAHELASSVAAYLAAGFDALEPAVVVATPGHRQAVEEHLRALGWATRELEREGMLRWADAHATLDAIMDGDAPSARRFERVVGSLLDSVQDAAGERPVRVFGEMVDLLCERGNPRAAAALEALWNRLGGRRNFSLLCGYRADLFDLETQVTLVPEICRSHSHVLPVEDPERFGAAVDAALDEALGRDAHKVYALVAPQIRKGQVPASQLVLTWVSANMPKLAERVLATARRRYLHNPVH